MIGGKETDWGTVEQAVDHFLNQDADVLKRKGKLPLSPEDTPKATDLPPQGTSDAQSTNLLPLAPAETDTSPKKQRPDPQVPADNSPQEPSDPNDAKSEARSEIGQTEFAIGQILYSLPFIWQHFRPQH